MPWSSSYDNSGISKRCYRIPYKSTTIYKWFNIPCLPSSTCLCGDRYVGIIIELCIVVHVCWIALQAPPHTPRPPLTSSLQLPPRRSPCLPPPPLILPRALPLSQWWNHSRKLKQIWTMATNLLTRFFLTKPMFAALRQNNATPPHILKTPNSLSPELRAIPS